MGVLTDLIVARPEDAKAVSDADPTSARWPRIDVKGMDEVMLSTLWALLRDSEYDADDPGRFELVHQAADDGPWVSVVPPGLVALLAALRPDQVDGIASSWSRTEELEGIELANVESYLQAIKSLAERAQTDSSTVLMWTCL